MNDKSDTPRTDAIMRLVRDAEHELDREREYAMLEAAQNGIEQLERELAEARADLQFVERWANHHGAKPSCTAEEALSVIQHYPPIKAITESYEDGKVPDTRNPWAELAAVTEERDRLRELPDESFHCAVIT